MAHLTETQTEIVEFIRDRLERGERSPTYDEIAAGTGYAVRAIQYQLDKLETAGVVSRKRSNGRVQPRSISIVDAAA